MSTAHATKLWIEEKLAIQAERSCCWDQPWSHWEPESSAGLTNWPWPSWSYRKIFVQALFGMNSHSMLSLASVSLSTDWNSSFSSFFADANVEALSDINFLGGDLRLANLRKASKKVSTVKSSTTSRWIALVVAQVNICRRLFQFQRIQSSGVVHSCDFKGVCLLHSWLGKGWFVWCIVGCSLNLLAGYAFVN